MVVHCLNGVSALWDKNGKEVYKGRKLPIRWSVREGRKALRKGWCVKTDDMMFFPGQGRERLL